MSSFATAFVTVFGVIFIVFRSWRFGLLTIVPNVLPVVAVLGVMGYLGISMNIATVMVASVALGVVDDDTIHFINRYRREIGQRRDDRRSDRDRDDARGARVADDGDHQQRRVRRAVALGVQADGVVRRVARADDGGGVPRGGLHPSRHDQAAAGRVRCRTRCGEGSRAAAVVVPARHSVRSRARPASRSRARPATCRLSWTIFRTVTIRSKCGRGRSRRRSCEPSGRMTITLSGFAEGLVGRRLPPPLTVAVIRRRPRASRGDFQGARGERPGGRRSGLTSWSASAGPCGAVSTSCSPPTSSIHSMPRGSSSKAAARRACPLRSSAAAFFSAIAATIEGVYVPVFRKGRFDQIDEATSPFNIAAGLGDGLGVCLAIGCPTLPPELVDDEPDVEMSNAQGGLRVSGTAGVWTGASRPTADSSTSVSWSWVHRRRSPGGPVTLVRTYPRFTMVGGDFETVRGRVGFSRRGRRIRRRQLPDAGPAASRPARRSTPGSPSIAKPATTG